MPAFEDLGLREELVQLLEDEDFARPTGVQEAVIPALRRGGNLVARAGSGSGKTLAYALGVLDRLQASSADADSVPLRFLVLVPTVETADGTALSIFPFAQAVGLNVTAMGGSWGTPVTQAEILVTTTEDVMSAVRGSALKLDEVEAVVIDGASSIHELGEWEAVDALLDLVPRDAQRVVFTASLPDPVEDLIERRVKRALRYPSEPALEEAPSAMEGGVGYVLVPEREKLEILTRQLSANEQGEVPPVIFCRTDERAADLAEQLAIRGFLVGAMDDPQADVAIAATDLTHDELRAVEGGPGQTISYDVPPDVATLRARHADDDAAVVLVDPRELPHLRELGKQARFRVRALPLPLQDGATRSRLQAFREELRTALAEEDLGAQLLVLDPLLEEFSPIEIAAAATALLRERRPRAASAPMQTSTVRSVAAQPIAPAQQSGPAPATWARLYVGVGSRDDIRPGDLVGTLAGEANIAGAKIGKIEIRENFSIVEVQADVADQVIRSVNGTSVKGRSVRVDYDRGGERRPEKRGGPRRPPGRSEGPARRITRRPPQE